MFLSHGCTTYFGHALAVVMPLASAGCRLVARDVLSGDVARVEIASAGEQRVSEGK